MALVRGGGLVGTPSGTLGGAVVRQTRTRGVLGAKRGKARAPSQAQIDRRAVWKDLLQTWRTLAHTNQQAWQTWAESWTDDFVNPQPKLISGFGRFMAYASHALSAGVPILNAPSEAGRGPAEFCYPDLWANTEAGTLRITQLHPMMLSDPDPIRVVVSLGPPRPHARRWDPRAYTPIVSWDPVAGEPGIDSAPIVVPLPASPYPRPWLWGRGVVSCGAGALSSPGFWPLETVGPGQSWALRIRPIADFIELQRVEVTATQIVFYGVAPPFGAFVDPHNLGVAPNVTIANLRTTLNAISPWRVVDINSSWAGRSSADINQRVLSGKTVNTQPALLTVNV